MVLLVSYDLDHHARPSQYAAVEKMLKENSTSWAKPLYSQWFIETNESADTWSSRMKTVTDSNDYWLIVPVKRPYQGWLKQAVWDWLNARI